MYLICVIFTPHCRTFHWLHTCPLLILTRPVLRNLCICFSYFILIYAGFCLALLILWYHILADTVRLKLKSLRQYFFRELKNIRERPCGSAGKTTAKWEFFDYLNFLAGTVSDVCCASWSLPTQVMRTNKKNINLYTSIYLWCLFLIIPSVLYYLLQMKGRWELELI